MTRTFLILAGDTDGNLGDLAIVAATCAQIRRVNPNAEIRIPSERPERDAKILGVIPIRRGWRGLGALWRAVRSADRVICGGGGLFQDDDSLIKMPYWALRLLAVRRLGGSISGLCIGAGPLNHWISRWFARMALRQMDSISARDEFAHSVLAPLTGQRIAIVPDPAFLLDAAPEDHAVDCLLRSGVPLDKRPLVGVAIRRWFHKSSSILPYMYAARLGLHKDRGQEDMAVFVRLLGKALSDIVRLTNAHVVFLPTYNVPHEADDQVCRDVASRMPRECSTILKIDDPHLYKAITGQFTVMLCGRMHPAILAASMGTPIVGLSYNRKTDGMFRIVNQDRRCLSYADLVGDGDTNRLTDLLLKSIRNPSGYRPNTRSIEQEIRRYMEKLARPANADSTDCGGRPH